MGPGRLFGPLWARNDGIPLFMPGLYPVAALAKGLVSGPDRALGRAFGPSERTLAPFPDLLHRIPDSVARSRYCCGQRDSGGQER